MLNIARSKLQGFQRQATIFPKLGKSWREQGLDKLDHLANELQRTGTKRQFNSLSRSEKIRNNREGTPFNALEEQSGATLIDHPAMNFSRFQVRINLYLDRDKVLLLAQQIQKLSEITKRMN